MHCTVQYLTLHDHTDRKGVFVQSQWGVHALAGCFDHRSVAKMSCPLTYLSCQDGLATVLSIALLSGSYLDVSSTNDSQQLVCS